mgnify:CR=1 FL=1
MIKNVILILLCSMFIQAQEVASKKNMKIMMKWKLTEYLDLGEEQAEKFFPKMNTHEKDIKKINEQIKALRIEMERQIESGVSDKNVNRENIEKIQELEQKKLSLKSKYLLSLEDVLEPNQVSKLMVFEKRFKRSLKDQLKKRPNNRDINRKKKYPSSR